MRRRAIFGRDHRIPGRDLPDWTNIFFDDFNYNYPVGSFDVNQSGLLKPTAAAYAELGDRFMFYADGWSTTHDGKIYPKTSGEPGYIPGATAANQAKWPAIVSKYQPTKTISISNGVARFREFSELVGGVDTAYGATLKPILPSGNYKMGPYGRVEFRMRSTNVLAADGTNWSAANNFTTSPNLFRNWVPLGIDSNNWGPYGIPNGEFDAPEGSLNRAVAANYHPAVNPDRSTHITTGLSPYLFHTYVWEWTPGKWEWWADGVKYFTTTDNVPSMATAFLFQFECDWRQPTGEGTIEVDYISMWDYTPGSIPSSGGGSSSSLYDTATYDSSTYGA